MKTLERFKQNIMLQAFGFAKIPMIFFVSPRMVDMTSDRCEIRVPLIRRNKNHLGSMYFGVLCAGADIAGGLLAMNLIREKGNQVNLVFKDFKAEFLKRPTADVHFVSEDGAKVRELVDRAIASGERVQETVIITAHCPTLDLEPVAKFELTLSLKKKKARA